MSDLHNALWKFIVAAVKLSEDLSKKMLVIIRFGKVTKNDWKFQTFKTIVTFPRRGRQTTVILAV